MTEFLLLGVSFFGWGRFAVRVLGAAAPDPLEEGITVFAGWAFSLLILQVIHFFLPIDARVAIPLFVAGVVMSVPSLRACALRYSRQRSHASSIWLTALIVVASGWIVSRGMFPIGNFDSGLYHLQMIRWTSTYAIVPGLGNLHGRLAFNQSYFTYAAALNSGSFFGRAPGTANGFLFLALLVQSVQGLLRHSVSRTSFANGSNILTWGGHLLVLPVLVYLGLSTDGLNSPTPDLAATLLELSIFLLFVRGVGEWESMRKPSELATTVLPLLTATAITIKLSTVAFSGSILLACVLYELHPSHGDLRAMWIAARRLAPAAVIIAVWVASGLVLSGCPLYPSSFGCISVDWAIPAYKVVNEANWVYSWAREPGVPWQVVLGNWTWLGSWLRREIADFIGFLFPLAASIVLTISAIIIRRYTTRKTPVANRNAGFIILVPVVLGLLFWFFAAPDPRFGRVFFWMLSMGAALLLLHTLEATLAPASFRVAVTALVVAVNAPFIGYVLLKGGARVRFPTVFGPPPVTRPQLIATQTLSGLVLYVPLQGERCWDSPLPCTPYFNPHLALRVNGRIDQGFVDDPSRR